MIICDLYIYIFIIIIVESFFRGSPLEIGFTLKIFIVILAGVTFVLNISQISPVSY